MPEERDAKNIITASPLENWRRPPGRPCTTWMKTIQQDLKSNNLSMDKAINVAQNRPLWRLMSTHLSLVVHATKEEEEEDNNAHDVTIMWVQPSLRL